MSIESRHKVFKRVSNIGHPHLTTPAESVDRQVRGLTIFYVVVFIVAAVLYGLHKAGVL